jgi:hypothetical protein
MPADWPFVIKVIEVTVEIKGDPKIDKVESDAVNNSSP